MEKTCRWLGDLPAHGHLCKLQLGLLHCRDQGVRHSVPGRLHEGDPGLGRVSEVEVHLPASTGWIQSTGLQVLMISHSFSSKALLDTPSYALQGSRHSTSSIVFPQTISLIPYCANMRACVPSHVKSHVW